MPSFSTLGDNGVFRRILLLCGWWAVVFSFVQLPAYAAPGALPEARYNALLKKIDRTTGGGSVRVIVTVDASSEPVLKNSRSAFAVNAQLHSQRKSAVKRVQDHLARQLPSVTIVKRLHHQPAIVVNADTELLQQLRDHPRVVRIQEDRLSRPSLDQSVPLVGADIAAASGFEGAGWAVAVLDTGVDSTHDFLAGKVVAEACYSTSEASISLHSLCPDGSNVQVGSGAGINCSGTLGCDHGTHVAGIAAGQGDTLAGVAPEADIIAVQVFSELEHEILCGTPKCLVAFDSDIVLGLEFVYDLRDSIDVASVNMSLGGALYASQESCDADNLVTKAAIDDLRAAGIATVIASGNDGVIDAIGTPGCISTAVSVGATTNSDNVASFSNSASWLSLLAPGSIINSSVPGGGFQSKSGTSMATPHVAGAFAALKSKSPGSSVDELLAALTTTGQPIFDTRNAVTTPRIQVDAAVDYLEPSAAAVITVDNQDANTSQSGNWSSSSGPNPWDGQSLYSSSGTFRWLPNVTQAETYEVFAWWTYHKNRSSNVPYTIGHAGGSTTVEVNQADTSLGGGWISLGVFDFDGGGAYVEVSSANGQACADAVRLVPGSAAANLPPSVSINAPANGASFNQGESVTLQGSATDAEEGDLSSVIQWQSDIDGNLGSGASVISATLAPGTHTISATVVDGSGASDSASISLTIIAGGGGTEIIVDNKDATSHSGTWRSSSGPNPWAGQSVYNDADNTFRWHLDIAASNTYQVYAWWTYHSNRSATVPYTISHSSGSDTVVVNQLDPMLGGKWVLLGSYTFSTGSNHYVEVSSENGQASADAVRLVAGDPPANFPPTITIEGPADGTEFTQGDTILLEASASDIEDGSLSSSIQWWSNLDGALGGGAALPINSLSVGIHTITASITDSGGESASAAITLAVNAPGALEVIVDNQDTNTSSSGNWAASSGANPWEGQSVYNDGGETFRWSPNLSEPGNYRVYAWWTYHKNRSSNVPYRISHAGGTATVPVDQHDQGVAGQWILLGSYSFNGDSSGYVEVSSENGQASADAVRLVKQ